MSKLEQKLEQGQKLNPKQILEASIVQLNVINLEKSILKELEDNPALEIDEQTNSNDDEEKCTKINSLPNQRFVRSAKCKIRYQRAFQSRHKNTWKYRK